MNIYLCAFSLPELVEVKLGGFQIGGGGPTSFGKSLIVSWNPFGNVPRRCFHMLRKRKRTNQGHLRKKSGRSEKIGKIAEKIGKVQKRTHQGGQVQIGETPPFETPVQRP